MSQRKKITVIIISTAVPLFIVVTGMWDPLRWGVYFDSMRETAPISFYGQVVDAQGTPLANVQVRVDVLKHDWMFIFGADGTTAYTPYTVVTDPEGKFQISGKHGRAVQVSELILPGYKFKPRIKDGGWDTIFDYAGPGVGKGGPHKPDPDNPVTFEMVPTGRK